MKRSNTTKSRTNNNFKTKLKKLLKKLNKELKLWGSAAGYAIRR